MGNHAFSLTASRGPRLWCVAEVAELYGVDKSTVHRWERSGRIRAARRDPGGTKYWLSSEIIDDALRTPARYVATDETNVEALVPATRRRRHRR